MTDSPDGDHTLATHLTHLAASADDLSEMLTRSHEAEEVHQDALVKSERLSTSLREVIQALTKHEHLAMSSHDVWRTLTVEHKSNESGDSLT